MNSIPTNTFFRHFSIGVKTWFQAWHFIFRHKLVHFFIYPILLSILLGMGAVAIIRNLVNLAMGYISPHIQYSQLPEGNWWDKVVNALTQMGNYGIALVLWIIALYTFRKVNKYLILALMSPVMSVLSEKTEQILTGKTIPFSGAQFVRDIVRGIGLAVRNFFVEIFLSVILIWGVELFLTILFPPLGLVLAPVFAVISFGIGAYFFGFSTIDYYHERKRLSLIQSISEVRLNKGIAIGNGTVFSILFVIPLVGITLSTVTCTVAATLAMHKVNQPSLQNLADK